MKERLPEWLTVKAPGGSACRETAALLESLGLHTVCQSAGCPNIAECFSRHTATFMILGDTCTRQCGFCGVKHGSPSGVDVDEPARVAEAAKRMGLRYVVVTSVTRDDLPDGGAAQFAETIRRIKAAIPDAGVEVLIPDFKGDEKALRIVLEAGPLVLNHNMETVRRLYPMVRPAADYQRSLTLLETVRRTAPSIHSKSGFMLGLGESREEVLELLRDLRNMDCQFVTIGQYLRPSKVNLPVVEYVRPEKFAEYKSVCDALGFRYAASAPFVRSSYHAAEASA